MKNPPESWNRAFSLALQMTPIPKPGESENPRLDHARRVCRSMLKAVGIDANKAKMFCNRRHGTPQQIKNKCWNDRAWFGVDDGVE